MIVNDKILERYELVTTHNYHIAGHFTICKNNEYWRTLCFKIKNWQKLLTDKQHYSLDENAWSGLVNPYIKYIHRIYQLLLRPFGIHYFTALDLLNPILQENAYSENTDKSTCRSRKWYCKRMGL